MYKIKFSEELEQLLKTDKSLVNEEGILLKQNIKDSAEKFDVDLIHLLLNNSKTKEHFFDKVGGATIFNYRKFIDYIDDKNFLLDSYTKFTNKVGLTISNKHIKQNQEVVLSFPFKDCVLKGGQTKDEEKKKEIFFNEILAKDEITRLLDKKVLTKAKKYAQNGISNVTKFSRDDNGVIKDNLIIKGNNLLALHSLKSNFTSKIKLIYIDPPYNTGKDSFNYNDSFNHSTWLVFMKNRLEVARDLLRDDGAIFISINNLEHAYLKVLLDEIYGRENYVINFVWETKKGATGMVTENKVVDNYENILVYAKDKSQFSFKGIEREEKEFSNPDNDPRGPWKRQYLQRFGLGFSSKTIINPYNGMSFTFETPYSQEKLEQWIEENVIIFPRTNKNYPARKEFLKDYEHNKQIVANLGLFSTKSSTEDLYELFDGQKVFSTPKSEHLLYFLISQASNRGDIILDYHLGSGTTCAVAHKMGRQYIGIEQMDYLEDIAVERMKKVIEGEQLGISESVNWLGGREFLYFELAKDNQTFVDKVQAANEKSIFTLYDEVREKAFLNYDVEFKKLEQAKDDFINLSFAEQKSFLISILNKNQLYKNLSEIEDLDLLVNEKDKSITKDFYNE